LDVCFSRLALRRAARGGDREGIASCVLLDMCFSRLVLRRAAQGGDRFAAAPGTAGVR
jgi:hypothetical protein